MLPKKHHYIPAFYSSYWATNGGRLMRYTKPYKSKIDIKRSHPNEVGWELNLYRAPEPDKRREQWVEQELFRQIDNRAAVALSHLNASHPLTVSTDQMRSWTLFVRSLFHRTPHNLQATKEASYLLEQVGMSQIEPIYADLRGPTDPLSFNDYKETVDANERERAALRMLPHLFLNEKIGSFILNMLWRVYDLPDGGPTLLLSDDPVARTNGIAKEGGHIAMPLSPRRLLLMASSNATLDNLSRLKPKDLIRGMNLWTVSSARHFVYAVDRAQDRFIFNNFGNDLKPSLFADSSRLERVARGRDWFAEKLAERMKGSP